MTEHAFMSYYLFEQVHGDIWATVDIGQVFLFLYIFLQNGSSSKGIQTLKMKLVPTRAI